MCGFIPVNFTGLQEISEGTRWAEGRGWFTAFSEEVQHLEVEEKSEVGWQGGEGTENPLSV